MKENKLFSVAIPTYYSSEHISECLKSFIDIPKVNEIIINDDGSSYEEYKKLNKKIIKLNKKFNFDVKVSQNKKNLGGFKNKYLTVSKCKNNNIYQIDSDNFIDISSKTFFQNYANSEPVDNLLLPGRVSTVFEKKKFFQKKRSFNKITISNTDVEVNIKEAKTLISKNQNSIIPKDNNLSFKWLLNLGNPIFHKETYLSKLEEGYNSNDFPLEACSIALSFFWLKNGGKLKILKDMFHYQRIHKNSYYIREGEKAKNSVDFFTSQIMDLAEPS